MIKTFRWLHALAALCCVGGSTAAPRGSLRQAIADLRQENSAADRVLEDSDGIDEVLSQSLPTIDLIDSGVGNAKPQLGQWKNILVWVEPSDVIPEGPPSYFSQVGQDQSVVAAFHGKREGFFLDLAANDPVTLSNTLALERDYAWSGICIEANPQYWPRLAHRRCEVFGVVVGENDKDQLDVALDQRGVYGGIVGAQFDNKQKTSESKRRSVSLETILTRASAPFVIDYFSLDVEGAEEFIMKGFPFATYRFNLLTVERPSAVLQELLTNNSYVYVRDHGGFGDQMWRHATFPAWSS
jgi:hypothetical protein